MKIFVVLLVVLLCFTACGKEQATQVAETQPTTVAVTKPAFEMDVRIVGEPKTGAVVYAEVSDSSVEPVYQWLVDGEPLNHVSGEVLAVPFSAAGRQLQVFATVGDYTAESPAVTVTPETQEKLSMAAVAHDVKLYGRCGIGPAGLYLDYSASGFEMNVYSEGKEITFSYFAQYDAYVVVLVDGKQWDRPLLQEGTGTLTVPVTPGTHSLTLLKETEVNTSGKTLQLMTMELQGNLLEKPADRPLYIEVIGDSIACGDGALGTYTAGQKWSLEDHSGTNGFAYLTAQRIGADWSVFARGGIGLMKTAGDYTAGQIYPYVNLYRDKITRYQPARTPDVVIVELGANDDKNDTAGFVAAYNDLVDQIRELYGADVKIVWVGKNMNQYNSAQYVAQQRGDANMFAFQFTYGGSGSAALETQSAGHPSAAEQKAFAEALAGFLQKNVLSR